MGFTVKSFHLQTEVLAESLSERRDSAEAEVKRLHRDLHDAKVTLEAASTDLESALHVLQSHHLMAEYERHRSLAGHSLHSSYRQEVKCS